MSTLVDKHRFIDNTYPLCIQKKQVEGLREEYSVHSLQTQQIQNHRLTKQLHFSMFIHQTCPCQSFSQFVSRPVNPSNHPATHPKNLTIDFIFSLSLLCMALLMPPLFCAVCIKLPSVDLAMVSLYHVHSLPPVLSLIQKIPDVYIHDFISNDVSVQGSVHVYSNMFSFHDMQSTLLMRSQQ